MFSQIFEREKRQADELARLTSVNCPSDKIVKSALQKAEQSWKGLTEHDRFVPEKLGMPELFSGLYANGGLKLCHDKNKEWWRTDRDVENIPTVAGVIRQNLRTMMAPTDLVGRPFNLDMDDQIEWAKDLGGDTIDSVEETLFLVLRKTLESNIAPWAYGWCRCRNSGGRHNSLGVSWNAGRGLEVNSDGRDYQNSNNGALVRQSLS